MQSIHFATASDVRFEQPVQFGMCELSPPLADCARDSASDSVAKLSMVLLISSFDSRNSSHIPESARCVFDELGSEPVVSGESLK